MTGSDWLALGIAAWVTLSVPASVLIGQHFARRESDIEAVAQGVTDDQGRVL